MAIHNLLLVVENFLKAVQGRDTLIQEQKTRFKQSCSEMKFLGTLLGPRSAEKISTLTLAFDLIGHQSNYIITKPRVVKFITDY